MCSECGRYPCHSRCPNSDDDGVWGKCSNCGGEIYYGEKCVTDDDFILCEGCIGDMSIAEFLEFSGYDFTLDDLLDFLGISIVEAGE